MSLGSAIKTMRKNRGIKQKHFAPMVDISVNALVSIEADASWPQKATLDRICKKLGVPLSVLLLVAIDTEDIPEEKRKVVALMLEPIVKYLTEPM